MEENKCCESGACEKCLGKKVSCCRGNLCKKCPMLKFIVPIILIVLAFYLGTLVGGNKEESRGRGEGFMGEGYGSRGGFENKRDGQIPLEEEATVAPETVQ